MTTITTNPDGLLTPKYIIRAGLKSYKTILIFFLIVTISGCSDTEIDCDTDGDGCIDSYDDFPNKKFNLPESYPSGAFGYKPGETLNGKDFTADSDDDGIPDEIDYDRDGDGLLDNYPIDPSQEFQLSDSLKRSCNDDSDSDGCNDLFDHYPDDSNKNTDFNLYNEGDDVQNCEERMNDCERKYLNP